MGDERVYTLRRRNTKERIPVYKWPGKIWGLENAIELKTSGPGLALLFLAMDFDEEGHYANG